MVQNNDIKVRLTLTDGTNPYTINSLDDYEVYIYNLSGKDKNPIATYKKGNTGKYGITVNDSANGKIDIVIHRQDTKNATAGKLYAEVRVRLTAGSEFIASKQNVGSTGVEITDLLTSANKTSLT